jgi:hypothetical protein
MHLLWRFEIPSVWYLGPIRSSMPDASNNTWKTTYCSFGWWNWLRQRCKEFLFSIQYTFAKPQPQLHTAHSVLLSSRTGFCIFLNFFKFLRKGKKYWAKSRYWLGFAKTPEIFNAGVSAFFGAKPITPAFPPA